MSAARAEALRRLRRRDLHGLVELRQLDRAHGVRVLVGRDRARSGGGAAAACRPCRSTAPCRAPACPRPCSAAASACRPAPCRSRGSSRRRRRPRCRRACRSDAPCDHGEDALLRVEEGRRAACRPSIFCQLARTAILRKYVVADDDQLGADRDAGEGAADRPFSLSGTSTSPSTNVRLSPELGAVHVLDVDREVEALHRARLRNALRDEFRRGRARTSRRSRPRARRGTRRWRRPGCDGCSCAKHDRNRPFAVDGCGVAGAGSE